MCRRGQEARTSRVSSFSRTALPLLDGCCCFLHGCCRSPGFCSTFEKRTIIRSVAVLRKTRRMTAVTQDDFMNAIAANGADDDLQLVFSDWLEEHGNTLRAELVRIQVELAKVPNEDPRYSKLLK